MGTLRDIRKATSGNARTLDQFMAAVAGIRRRAVRAAQNEGRFVFRLIGQRYDIEMYAGKDHVIREISPFSERWRKRKRQLGLDRRKGVARKGILKTVKSPLAFVMRDDGFDIDLTRPNLTVTGRSTLAAAMRNLASRRIVSGAMGKKQVVALGFKRRKTSNRSFRVNAYISHFADKKAPGLGSISRDDQRRIDRRVRESVDSDIRRVKGAARANLASAAASTIVLRLDGVQ